LFEYGLTTGGPRVMSVGWIVVSFFTMFVGLGMAEIVSAIPSAGGPYFWSAILAPKKHAPFASWVTGWFNLLGQVAVTTGITFGVFGSSGASGKVVYLLPVAVSFAPQDRQSRVRRSDAQPWPEMFIEVFGDNGLIALVTLVTSWGSHCGLYPAA